MVLFKSHITLGLRGEKIFLIIIIATGLCLSLDALSVVAIHFRNLMPLFLVKFICKAYLISMVWVGWGNFCYVSLDIKNKKIPYIKFKRLSEIYAIIASIVIAVLPLGVYEGPDGIYSYGPAVISTYAFVLFSIVSILVVAIMVRRRKNSRLIVDSS